MTSPAPLNVLILAGGHSRRMGQDKALISWRGMSLLERCARVAQSVGDRCTIVTPWTQRYQDALPADLATQLHWHPDPHPGAGPPQAIAHLLSHPPTPSTPWTLILACDLPNLSAHRLLNWRSHLISLPPDALAYLPRTAKYWEPLCGFYRPQAGQDLQTYLDNGGRSLQGWLTNAPNIHPIPLDPADLPMLHNCNTPTDLENCPKP